MSIWRSSCTPSRHRNSDGARTFVQPQPTREIWDQRLRWTAGAFWKDSERHSRNQQVGVCFPGREAFGGRFDSLPWVPANTRTNFLEEVGMQDTDGAGCDGPDRPSRRHPVQGAARSIDRTNAAARLCRPMNRSLNMRWIASAFALPCDGRGEVRRLGSCLIS